MISEKQILQAESEFTLAAQQAFESAKIAERNLEHYTYYERPHSPQKREQLLAIYNDADYQAESRAWIRNLIAVSRKKSGIPSDAVCLFRDGNAWCAVRRDFENLQESPAGFGDTPEKAIAELAKL